VRLNETVLSRAIDCSFRRRAIDMQVDSIMNEGGRCAAR
jgi:hypothetical protein